MRPRANVTIDSLQEVEYEKSIGTKMNDIDLRFEVVSGYVLQPQHDGSAPKGTPLNLGPVDLSVGDIRSQIAAEWLRDRWRHVTVKGQTRDPNTFRAQVRKLLELDFKFGMQLCMGNTERAHKYFSLKVGAA